jgi:hypothetical protein
VLVVGYVGTLVGLRLVAVAPFQLSVLAMMALGGWLVCSNSVQAEGL